MSGPVLVTGATGNVGREVVRELVARGAEVVAAVMDPADAARLPAGSARTAILDYERPETFDDAVAGVRGVFLLRPPQIADVRGKMYPFVDSARRAGVEQVAFVSLIGVERARMVPHHKLEQYITASGTPYTFLRPSFYMQNLNTVHREEIRDRNTIALPVGRARTSFIDTRDIGEVAATVLTTPGHLGAAYDLTGQEALDYYEVARLFTGVLGRTITYTDPSPLAFYRSLIAGGTPRNYALIMLALYTSTRFGMAQRVTGEVQRLLGRPPITMRQYIEDYSSSWV